jgi:diguanylate cyclase (GGDEF)-like protein/PAS domain S-box-containing protein
MNLAFPSLRTISRPSRLIIQLGFGVVLLNLFAAFAAWYSLQQSWYGARDRAQVATQNLAQLLDRDITAAFDHTDLLLQTIGDEYRRQTRRGRLNTAEFDRYLADLRSRASDLINLYVADAAGNTRYSAGGPLKISPSIAERDYFIRLRDNPKAGMVISPPVVGNVSHKWVIVLARRIERPDGSFAGVALAPIALERLQAEFASLNLGRSGAISLRDDTLRLIVRYPGPVRQDTESANRIVSKELAAVVGAHPEGGAYDAPTALDQIERRNAYRKLARYPYYILVGLATADYLGEWHQQQIVVVLFTAAFAAVTLLLSWLVFRAWGRQETDLAILRDNIRERKRAEETLQQSEASYRSIFDNMLNGIAQCRMLFKNGHPDDFIYLRVNDAFANLTGLHGVVGKRVTEVIPGIRESDPKLFEIYGRVAATGQPERFETYVEALKMWFRVSVYSPEREHFVAVFDVITERKRAEEDLRIAATAFEAQEGMIVTDAHLAILRVNRAFAEATGYDADELIGKTPRVLKSGRQDAAFYAAMWQRIVREGSWQGELWNRRKDGVEYPEWLTITAVKNAAGEVTHYVGTMTDITERKTAEAQIQHLAYYDSLTHLPNRRLLNDRLQQALAASTRSRRQGALLFIDLDNFKSLNDTRGHDIGDRLLVEVAMRLGGCVREGDTVARLGGDEFLVMLLDLSGESREAAAQARTVAEKIIAALNCPYQLAGHEHHSTPSIGITLFSNHHDSVEDLLKQADMAMYQAKTAGRNALRFFDPAMQASVLARVTLEEGLRAALERNEFVLFYQAQVDRTGNPTGAEALLRWNHPLRGLVSPAEFIGPAEDIGLIVPLGRWVLESACRQLVAWSDNPALQRLTIAVNVSARQFRDPGFVAGVIEVLDTTGADPQQLKLELTESLFLDDIEETIARMTALKARGVGFSLDDFGTGYSSLAYLKRLPLDQLKIDQSFVRDVLTDANDAAIARTVVALAQSLGLTVIAEGVETEAQRRFLEAHGCHAYQGYLFSRPAVAAEFERRVRELRREWSPVK